MKKIITYGTFDLFHIGHLQLLKRCKEYGNHLTVCVSSDQFNEKKGKQTVIQCNDRVDIVKSIRYVDQVIIENSWDQKIDDIIKYDIDILIMGDDWEGKFDYLNTYCEVIYLPRTPKVSSTEIKTHLKKVEDYENT